MRLLPAALIVFVSLFTVSHALGQEKKEDDKPPYYLTDAQLDKKLGVDEKAKAPEEFVWLIYFHRVPGCDTCQLMSKYIYETVEKRFVEEVKNKQIVLRYKNFEDKKNADLVKRFNIKSPMLVVVQIKDGKLVKAKHAEEIWPLAADKKKFIDYVEKEIKAYFSEPKEQK